MTNKNSLINKFITEEIALSQKDISKSAASREWFLTRIKNKIEEKIANGEKVPQLNKQTPFVRIGSYFKGTKVSDVDEFDILVVFDSKSGEFSLSGEIIGYGVGEAEPCHKYNNRFKKSDGSGVSPSKLLNWLKSIVQEVVDSFGGEAPIRDGQAITAIIKSKNLAIDLVPAGKFIYKDDKDEHFYDIPKGNKANGWILTKPESDINMLNYYASKCEGLKNIIRIIKSVNKSYNFNISSFAVECSMLYFANNSVWSTNIYENLINALKYYSKQVRNKEIKDTFDFKSNLIEHLDVNGWYADRIDNIVDTITKIPLPEIMFDSDKAYKKIKKVLKNE